MQKDTRMIQQIEIVNPIVQPSQKVYLTHGGIIRGIRQFKGQYRLIIESTCDSTCPNGKDHDEYMISMKSMGSYVMDYDGWYLDTIIVNDLFWNVYVRDIKEKVKEGG